MEVSRPGLVSSRDRSRYLILWVSVSYLKGLGLVSVSDDSVSVSVLDSETPSLTGANTPMNMFQDSIPITLYHL